MSPVCATKYNITTKHALPNQFSKKKKKKKFIHKCIMAYYNYMFLTKGILLIKLLIRYLFYNKFIRIRIY